MNLTTWEDRAIFAVEESIDNLITDFIQAPYLHRVEQSIHCELYRLLANHRILSSFYPLKDGQFTQCIHKEWPAQLNSETAVNRGHFDFSIISPKELKQCYAEDFENGRVNPLIAVEMGFKAVLHHLREDYRKLVNSNCSRHRYLVHILRNNMPDNQSDLEEFIAKINDETKVAYASVSPEGAVRYKLLNDDSVRSHEYLPQDENSPKTDNDHKGDKRQGEILACITVGNGCSMRIFDAENGLKSRDDVIRGKGSHQQSFRDDIQGLLKLKPPHPIDILHVFENGLPQDVLEHFQKQIEQSTNPVGPSYDKKEWFFRPHAGPPRGKDISVRIIPEEITGEIIACVNAQRRCSLRRFNAQTGRFLTLEPYRDGDYQEAFADILRGAQRLSVRRQPNLEKECKPSLPQDVLDSLHAQIKQDKQEYGPDPLRKNKEWFFLRA